MDAVGAGRAACVRALLCAALLAALPAGAQAAERSAAGLTAVFTAEPKDRVRPGEPPYWVLDVGQGAERRIDAMGEIRLPAWTRLFAHWTPDVLLTQGAVRLEADLAAGLDQAGGGDLEVFETELQGYPALFVSLMRHDPRQPWPVARGRPATIDGLRHVSGYLVLIDGRFVGLMRGAQQPVDEDDAFFTTLRTPQPAPARDVDAQWRQLCIAGGVAALLALGLLLGLVIGIDRWLRRRKRRRAVPAAASA